MLVGACASTEGRRSPYLCSILCGERDHATASHRYPRGVSNLWRLALHRYIRALNNRHHLDALGLQHREPMHALILALIGFIDPSIREANAWAAQHVGYPHIVHHLDAISRRESRDTPIGIHARDARYAHYARTQALRRRWLAPDCLSYRSDTGMATIGSHGLFFAYNAKRLAPVVCVPSWVFIFPKVSAYAAARRWLDLCWREGPGRRKYARKGRVPPGDGWCPQRLTGRQVYSIRTLGDRVESWRRVDRVGTTLYYRNRGRLLAITPDTTAQYVSEIER